MYALPLMVGRVVLLSANMAIGGVSALSTSRLAAGGDRPHAQADPHADVVAGEQVRGCPRRRRSQRTLITVSVGAQRTHV